MKTRSIDSVAGTDDAGAWGFDNLNAAQIIGIAAVGSSLAGGAMIGAMVAPSQVIGGTLMGGVLLGAGQIKAETGSYLPFVGGDKAEAKDDAPAPTAPVAAPAAPAAAAEPQGTGVVVGFQGQPVAVATL